MAGIKTRFRCAVGSHLSYPVRLSTIQDALGSVVDKFDIEVRFWDYKAARPGQSLERYPVVEVEYDPDSPEIRTIRVNPLPKELSKQIQERVVSLLGERVGPWLLAKRSVGWNERYHALRISFVTQGGEFDFYEHNQA